MNIGTLTVLLGANTAGLTRAATNMRKFETQVIGSNTRIQASFDMLGSKMMLTGTLLTQYLTVPLSLLGGFAVKTFGVFESELSKIVSLSGVASKTVSEWGSSLLGMSRQVGKAPKELASSLYLITNSGIRGAESLEILKKSSLASSIGLGETNDVVKAITSTMAAYGSETMSVNGILDIFIRTLSEGLGDASEYVRQLPDIAPIATKLGISFDQVGAAVASLSLTGTPVAEATTQIRRLLNTFIKQTPGSVKEFKRLGFSIDEVTESLKNRGLLPTLMIINDAVQKNTNSLAQSNRSFGDMFPNINALLPVLSILGVNLEKTKNVFESTAMAVGDFSRATNVLGGQVQFRWNQAMGSLQSSLIRFGNAIKEPIMKLIGQFVNLVDRLITRFTSLTQAQQQNIIKWVAFGAALGPLLLILGPLTTLIANLGKSLFLIFSNPTVLSIMAIVTAVFLLNTAIWSLVQSWDKVLARMKVGWNSILIGALQVVDWFQTFDWGQLWIAIWDSIKQFFQDISEWVKVHSKDIWDGMYQGLKTVSGIQTFEDALLGLLKLPDTVSATGIRIFDALFGTKEQIQQQSDETTKNVEKEASKIQKLIEQMQKANKDILKEVEGKEGFGDVFKRNLNSQFDTIKNALSSGFSKLTGGIFENLGGVGGFGLGNEEDVKRQVDSLKQLDNEIWQLVNSYMTLNKEKESAFPSAFIEANKEVWKVIKETNSALVQNANLAEMLGKVYNKTGTDANILQEAINKLIDPKLGIGIDPQALAILQRYVSLFNQLTDKVLDNTQKLQLWGNVFRSVGTLANTVGKYLGETFQKVFRIISDIVSAVSSVLQIIKNVGKLTEKTTAITTTAQTVQTAVTNANTGALVANTVASEINAAAKEKNAAADLIDAGSKSVNTAATQVNTLAKISNAISSAVSWLVSTLGPVGLIGAAAAITGIIALISSGNKQAKGATQMANGGIIPSGYPNDTFPALLSSGEAVIPLNKQQDLFSNSFSRGRGLRLQPVTLKVEGRDLKAILDFEDLITTAY